MTNEEQRLRKLLRETIDAWSEFNGLMHASAGKEATAESNLELRQASARFTAAVYLSDEYLRTGRTPRKPRVGQRKDA